MGRPLDRDRLAKLLGMLGSAHDGEIVAAARQAERMRCAAGLTWTDILAPSQVEPDPDSGLKTFLRQLLQHHRLTDWERDFCRSLIARRRGLTPKQWRVLDGIVDKCQRDRRAA